MLIPPFQDYLWNCQEDQGMKNAGSEIKKKKKRHLQMIDGSLVVGQSEDSWLQVTETNLTDLRNLLKCYLGNS
jgi:hypothetical protein